MLSIHRSLNLSHLVDKIKESKSFQDSFTESKQLNKTNFYHGYRVTQTPTLWRVHRLSLDSTNRILRDFMARNEQDLLLRISFTNEKGEKDHFADLKMLTLLEEQIKYRLTKGLHICDTHFRWFGQSNSQIKLKSFWFIDSSFDKESIIKQYGEFTDEGVLKK